MSLHTASEFPAKEILPAQAPDTVIRLDEVSVRYRVPHERIGTFKEYVIRQIQRRVNHDEFWALHHVNLQVQRGDVFGIVGRNGAGKSTLLKVLARVLRPTEGRVQVYGKVVPILELSGAFHPELTGRENVFLNSALLGHSRRDIEAHLEQIVDFAELREFIDAPLRTYSAGMMARLGFAVATAWEPQVLLLDEVLAVGDEAFQRKCYARLNAFRDQGATVLLVSHNMAVVEKMCQRAAWLEHGVVRAVGPAADVIAQYRNETK